MKQLFLLLPLLPILVALINQLFAKQLGRSVAKISVRASFVSFIIAVILLGDQLAGSPVTNVHLGNGIGILLSDPLSCLMAVLITGISLIVRIYSVKYMAEEDGYGRFFILLDLMVAALLLMGSAGDLLTMVMSWHLVGVVLYFLIGFNLRSALSSRHAFWTLITYRIGDLAMMLAAGILFHTFGTWSLSEIFAEIRSAPGVHKYGGFTVEEITGALVAVAAFARSAQFLLHTWLPYTMGGPTPVSALMHVGIVNAGGFLINRFAPIFAQTEAALHVIFFVGLITAIIGSVLMLTQNDIKKALGYSTMGQMGFMVMECGVGAFSLAIYHLIAHGFFKGTLFLSAGSAISKARKHDGVPKQDLYTFAVERKTAVRRQPWLVMALITIAVPIAIIFIAHWLVAKDFYQKQGAIILLFFGWVTGAQLLFTTYRMNAQNFPRMIGTILISFTVLIAGYTLMGHAFDHFLYPDEVFRKQIYSTATIDVVWFDLVLILTTLVIVAGWIFTYYSEQNRLRDNKERCNNLWLSFYALISREFYLMDIYSWMARSLLQLAARINVLLRWR